MRNLSGSGNQIHNERNLLSKEYRFRMNTPFKLLLTSDGKSLTVDSNPQNQKPPLLAISYNVRGPITEITIKQGTSKKIELCSTVKATKFTITGSPFISSKYPQLGDSWHIDIYTEKSGIIHLTPTQPIGTDRNEVLFIGTHYDSESDLIEDCYKEVPNFAEVNPRLLTKRGTNRIKNLT